MSIDGLPTQCVLDQAKLNDISFKVSKISDQMDVLESRSGPIAAHEHRLSTVESQLQDAAENLNKHAIAIDDIKKTINGTWTKLAALMAPLAAAIGAAVGAVVAKSL
jgi:septal ring factor EnvC (AmiA/AmiB activator)